MPDVAVGTIFRGLGPFIVMDLLRVALILLFPGLVLALT